MDQADQAKKIDQAIEEMEKEDVRLDNYSTKDSKGLGDTVEKWLGFFGITEEGIEKVAGMGGCNCQKRKQFLNRIFPYRKKKED